MANVVGVFYVLGVGVTFAMFLAFIAVVLETWSVCRENKVCSCEFIHSSRAFHLD